MAEHVPVADSKQSVSNHTSLKSQSQDLVESFVLFCEKHGVDVNEFDSAMKLCVIIGLRGVDIQNLCKSLLPTIFVDWNNITPGMLVFGSNTVSWINTMQFFHLDEKIKSQANSLSHTIPDVLTSFTQLLKESGIILPMDHVMRLFILCSVTNQPMSAVVYQYTRLHHHSKTTDSNTEQLTIGVQKETVASNLQAQKFVGKYVDNRVKFESHQCYEGMHWIFTNIAVEPGFMQYIRFFNENRLCVKTRMELKAKQVYSGRLRLRDRLNSIGPSMQAHTDMYDDTFDAWCTRVRFPNNISLWLKQKLYFIRAQTYDVTQVVSSLVSEEVASLIMKNAINNPEVCVIDAVIERLRFHSKPFPMMKAFHSEAFTGLSKTQVREIQNPMVMKLYVASYQKKNWRLHWCAILPECGMNHTIITHVERFVASHDICSTSITEMLKSC